MEQLDFDQLIDEALKVIRDHEEQLMACPDCTVLPLGAERPGDFRLMTEHAGFVKTCSKHS